MTELWGFPGGSDGKESACNAGDLGSVPGWGRSPGEGNGNPLQCSCLEDLMDRGAWQATVHRVAESRTDRETDTLQEGVAHCALRVWHFSPAPCKPHKCPIPVNPFLSATLRFEFSSALRHRTAALELLSAPEKGRLLLSG